MQAEKSEALLKTLLCTSSSKGHKHQRQEAHLNFCLWCEGCGWVKVEVKVILRPLHNRACDLPISNKDSWVIFEEIVTDWRNPKQWCHQREEVAGCCCVTLHQCQMVRFNLKWFLKQGNLTCRQKLWLKWIKKLHYMLLQSTISC